MSKANQVFGTLTGAPGAGALRRWTPCVLLALVLAAAAWFALDLPTFAQAEDTADGTPLWSADLSVVELENGAIGAIQAGDFSNQGSSAGLTAKWLYYYPPERKLRLSFSDGASVKGHVLQVGDFSVAFTENDSGNNSFTWDRCGGGLGERADPGGAHRPGFRRGHPGHRRSHGQRESPGPRDAERGHLGHRRPGRSGQRHLFLPVAVRRLGHRPGHRQHLHAGRRGPGEDDQREGVVHG